MKTMIKTVCLLLLFIFPELSAHEYTVPYRAYTFHKAGKLIIVDAPEGMLPIPWKLFALEVNENETYFFWPYKKYYGYACFPFYFGDREYNENDSIEIGGWINHTGDEVSIGYIRPYLTTYPKFTGKLTERPLPQFDMMPLLGSVYGLDVESETPFVLSSNDFWFSCTTPKPLTFDGVDYQMEEEVEITGTSYFRFEAYEKLFKELEIFSMRLVDVGFNAVSASGVRTYFSEGALIIESKQSPVVSIAVFDTSGRMLFASYYPSLHQVPVSVPGYKGVAVFRISLQSGELIHIKTLLP